MLNKNCKIIPPKQAMILAAGLGTRMRNLTQNIPKPMVEVAGKPLIDYSISALELVGVEKIVINISYKAEIIKDYLKNHSSSEIILVHEQEPLETGGGIANALAHFNDTPFFCINSDVIWFDKDKNSLELLSENFSEDLDALLLLHPTDSAIGGSGNGDFFLNNNNYLSWRLQANKAPYIYTGIQILRPSLFKNCPKGKFSSLLLYERAMISNPPKIKGILHNGVLLNVGDPEGKKLADEYVTKHFVL